MTVSALIYDYLTINRNIDDDRKLSLTILTLYFVDRNNTFNLCISSIRVYVAIN